MNTNMTLEKQVEDCLQKDLASRNSDITLMIRVWHDYYGIVGDVIHLESLYSLPKQDNIKRIRAKFNHNGKYYPTNYVIAKQRGISENEWRLRLGYPLKEDTLIPSKEKSYMDMVQ